MQARREVNENVDIQLRRFIENIERLESEKSEISQSISEKYKEAKSVGFDTNIMRKIVSIRKKDKDTLFEEESLLETYKQALGML
jgi:uncharacterized protein (UPF0335 family)